MVLSDAGTDGPWMTHSEAGCQALTIALKEKADLAILQSRSPSCGVKAVYDGTFSGKIIPGEGVFAALLRENGIRAIDAADIDA